VDLARLAGLTPAGVICEIMNPDGSMARRPELEAFAKEHRLRIVTIAELVEYRFAHDSLIETVSERTLETEAWGEIRALVMRSRVDDREHLVLVKGEIDPESPTLIRVQSIDLPADLVGLTLSGGGAEMRAAMETIVREGKGVFVYLVRSVEGSRLSTRLDKIDQASTISPTYNRVGTRMDLREFGTGAQILKAVGVRKFRLMSNHDVRIVGIEGFGLEVVERVPLPVKEAR
jgi:3,4-dihydroxy 2-butanone 4-phosphate synthase/GTP cyclohydrolase II